MGMFKTSRRLQHAPRKVSIRKNDQVLVTAGKDRGKKGRVLRVDPAKGTALVERVNFVKRHTKANPQKNQKGGILEREASISLSNLMVICPSCAEATRIGKHVTDEGSARVCNKCDAELK
jgi:large subunit ribosomal protein L24